MNEPDNEIAAIAASIADANPALDIAFSDKSGWVAIKTPAGLAMIVSRAIDGKIYDLSERPLNISEYAKDYAVIEARRAA